jgi:hypothetical protein
MQSYCRSFCFNFFCDNAQLKGARMQLARLHAMAATQHFVASAVLRVEITWPDGILLTLAPRHAYLTFYTSLFNELSVTLQQLCRHSLIRQL